MKLVSFSTVPVLCLLVNALNAAAVSKGNNPTLAGYQQRALDPTFEEDWKALAGDSDSSENGELDSGELEHLFLPDALPETSLTDPTKNHVQPPKKEDRKNGSATQLISDMEDLGINKDPLNVLNATTSATVPSNSPKRKEHKNDNSSLQDPRLSDELDRRFQSSVDAEKPKAGYQRPEIAPRFEDEWEALEDEYGNSLQIDEFEDVDLSRDFRPDVVPEISVSDYNIYVAQPPGNMVTDIGSVSQLKADMEALGITDGFDLLETVPAAQLPRNEIRRAGIVSQFKADMEALGIGEDVLNASIGVAVPSKPPSSRFLTTNMCGKKFLCRKGVRGPCRQNEVLVPLQNVSISDANSSTTCAGLASSSWNGCFPVARIGSAAALNQASRGVCRLRYPSRPCFGYPAGYRYSKSTKRCYPCSNLNQSVFSGPCPPNKIFVDVDGMYGSCRCRDSNSLLSWKDNKCHRIYSRGPCSSGEWLAPFTNGIGICKRSPCPSKCDGRHIYWKGTPMSRGGCYKSFTRGPCRQGSYFLIEDYPTMKGRCVSRYSAYDPMGLYRGYGGRRNSQLSSLWSNFGLYAPLQYDLYNIF